MWGEMISIYSNINVNCMQLNDHNVAATLLLLEFQRAPMRLQL